MTVATIVAVAVSLAMMVSVPAIVGSTAAAQTTEPRDLRCGGKTLLQSALSLAQAMERGESTTGPCDINGDGAITNVDVRAIEQCHLGIKNWTRCANAGLDVPDGRDKPENFDAAIDFTQGLETPVNVTGALSGHLAFIQATLVTPSNNVNRPDLVPGREALLLFFPSNPNQAAISAKVGSRYYQLVPPENLPRHDGPTGREPIVYSKRAWSAVVDAADMRPGMTIQFRNGAGATGSIPASGFTFGAPLEATVIALRLGMLVDEIETNSLTVPGLNSEIALNYYNTTPLQKFRIAMYEPIDLQRIVLADGTVYTDKSADVGVTNFTGDLRQQIAKSLIGSGITFANIGIPAVAGITEAEPRPFRQTTIIATSGTYTGADGAPVVVRHGQVGGSGQVLLFGQLGNEFSHEYGHDYGLGHYPGGDLSTQGFTGGWGYDITRDRLIANLRWGTPNPDGPLPWAFNSDAMAGGGNFGSIGYYTLHTPYSLQLMQDNLTSRSGWLDSTSPTGYTGWDFANQKTIPWSTAGTKVPVPEEVGRPVTTIAGFYDPQATLTSWVAPAMHGNWGISYSPLAMNTASGNPTTCQLTVSGNSADRVFNLPDTRLNAAIMNQFHVNVPATFKASKATITCSGQTLATEALKGPVGQLTDVVEVGGTAGFAKEEVRAPIVAPLPSTRREGVLRTLSNVYGPIHKFVPGAALRVGEVYEFEGNYYQARAAAATAPPGSNWRLIADAKTIASATKATTIAVGEKSAEYRDPTTWVYYTVALDGSSVIASEAIGPGAWYDRVTKYVSVTVAGTAANGATAPIVLRVQSNGAYAANTGFSRNVASYFTASFHPEDNVGLAKGTYRVDFEVQAQGWQTSTLVDAFRVAGPVTVD